MLKRNAILRTLTLDFELDGRYAQAKAIFQQGAWDTDAKEWVGQPLIVTQDVSTSDAEGRKRLNDFLSLASTAVLERNEELRRKVKELEFQLKTCRGDLDVALTNREFTENTLKRAEAERDAQQRLKENAAAASTKWCDTATEMHKRWEARGSFLYRLTFGFLGGKVKP